MTNRSHDHDLIAIVILVIAVLIASVHPLPGLQAVAAVLPLLADLVTALRK
jgi:hypothetical protein